jgi:hypothetical protein
MAPTSCLTFSCDLRVRVAVPPRSEHRRLQLARGERGGVAKNYAVRLGPETEQRGSASTEAVSRRQAREARSRPSSWPDRRVRPGTRVARSRGVCRRRRRPGGATKSAMAAGGQERKRRAPSERGFEGLPGDGQGLRPFLLGRAVALIRSGGRVTVLRSGG